MAKRIPLKTIKNIRILRSRGWTLPEIYRKYKIGYGTVWRYIQNVQISPMYRIIWESKRKGSIKRKLEAEKKAYKKAFRKITSFSKVDKMLILSTLYWGEGTKKDLSLTNTDPELIRIFVYGLKKVFKIPKNRIKLNIRIYEDMNSKECINFWLKITNLGYYNLSSVNILKGKKIGKLNYGMCRVRVLKGSDMLKYLVAIKQRIIECFPSP
jgi:hypothetical protein